MTEPGTKSDHSLIGVLRATVYLDKQSLVLREPARLDEALNGPPEASDVGVGPGRDVWELPVYEENIPTSRESKSVNQLG